MMSWGCVTVCTRRSESSENSEDAFPMSDQQLKALLDPPYQNSKIDDFLDSLDSIRRTGMFP